jgi:hypothetical protein
LESNKETQRNLNYLVPHKEGRSMKGREDEEEEGVEEEEG